MKLYDYQEEFVQKAVPILNENNIVYLALYQRTGKTPISLTIAKKIGAKQVLFVTKKKAISSIKADFEKLSYNYSLEIVNYESLHKINETYDTIIIDEAHSGISGYPKPSKSFKELQRIARLSECVIYLSGTPTPESYSQIYHQLQVSPYSPFKEYKSFYKWAKDYVDVTQERRGLYMVNDYSKAKKDIIDEKIKHLFLSMTQKEAGFESIIDEHFISVNMKEKTINYFKDLTNDRIITINEDEVVADTPAKLSQKLHQLSGGTMKMEDGSRVIIDDSKAIAIRDQFKNQKVVIFYKFIAERELLENIFEGKWTSCPDEFKNGHYDVFLAQYVSGREGINLSIADDIVFYNLDFSAVSYFQARERVSTRTKINAVRLWWIFSDTGFEKKVHKALSNKKDFTISHYLKGL